jgi:hypothetical protein
LIARALSAAQRHQGFIAKKAPVEVVLIQFFGGKLRILRLGKRTIKVIASDDCHTARVCVADAASEGGFPGTSGAIDTDDQPPTTSATGI